MKKMFSLFLTTVLSLSVLSGSMLAYAHPGHDHGSWMSSVMHNLDLIALLTAVCLGLALLLGKYISPAIAVEQTSTIKTTEENK